MFLEVIPLNRFTQQAVYFDLKKKKKRKVLPHNFAVSSTPGFSVSFSLPGLKVVDGLLHALLVVANHILVHVGIVGADVLFGAAVGHRTKAQRWVLLRRLLKLHKENRWAEIKVTDGKRGVKKRERENLKKKERG